VPTEWAKKRAAQMNQPLGTPLSRLSCEAGADDQLPKGQNRAVVRDQSSPHCGS